MQLNWMTISEKVIVEKDTENPSLINIFTNTKTTAIPFTHQFYLSLNVSECDIGESFVVYFIGPDKQKVGIEKSITVSNSEMNIYVNIQMEFKKAGLYHAVLEKDGGQIGKARLLIELAS